MSVKILNLDPKNPPPVLQNAIQDGKNGSPVLQNAIHHGDIEDALTSEIKRATGKAPCKTCGP